jgi:hypothetical protein
MKQPPDGCVEDHIENRDQLKHEQVSPSQVTKDGTGCRLETELTAGSQRALSSSAAQTRVSAPYGYVHGIMPHAYVTMCPFVAHPQGFRWTVGYGAPVLASYQGVTGPVPFTGPGGVHGASAAAAAAAMAAGAAAVANGTIPTSASIGRNADRSEFRWIQPPTREALYQQELYYHSAQMLGIAAPPGPGVEREGYWHSWASGEASSGIDSSFQAYPVPPMDHRYPGFYTPYVLQKSAAWPPGPNARRQPLIHTYGRTFDRDNMPNTNPSDPCSRRKVDSGHENRLHSSIPSRRHSSGQEAAGRGTQTASSMENSNLSEQTERNLPKANGRKQPDASSTDSQRAAETSLSLVSSELPPNQTRQPSTAADAMATSWLGSSGQHCYEISTHWEQMSRSSSGASAQAMPSDAASQNGLDRASSGDDETPLHPNPEQRLQALSHRATIAAGLFTNLDDLARSGLNAPSQAPDRLDRFPTSNTPGSLPYAHSGTKLSTTQLTAAASRDQTNSYFSKQDATEHALMSDRFPRTATAPSWENDTQPQMLDGVPSWLVVTDLDRQQFCDPGTRWPPSEPSNLQQLSPHRPPAPISPSSTESMHHRSWNNWERERYRRQRVQRFLEKRRHRVTQPGLIRYDVRKRLADARPRVRGRFARPETTTSAGEAASNLDSTQSPNQV